MATTGFSKCMADFAAISKEIDAGRYAGVYLLMGEEGYFIDELSSKLSENVLTESEKAFNRIIVYGKDTECGEVINFCRQMPMTGRYQVVIVREAQRLPKLERLSPYLQSPASSAILVLCHKEKNVDKRSALYKMAAKNGVVFESVRPRDYETGSWLTGHVRQRGCNIEPAAVTMITEHLGTDIAKISNELTKLFTFLPEGVKTVTADHIEQNIGISKDFNNFELTRAVSEGDAGRALMIAEHFARNPREYPLVVTLSTLFSHFRRIFIVNYQKWSARRKGSPMPSDAELSAILKVNPYFVGEYKKAAALYSNRRVYAIMGHIREYDMKSKGMEGGGLSDGELLNELLLRIFLSEN